jgi:hypothetical protein
MGKGLFSRVNSAVFKPATFNLQPETIAEALPRRVYRDYG